MYNEEQKKRFIAQYSTKISVREACADMFKATEKYEAELGSDLCAMSSQQISGILSDITASVRSRSSNMRITFLREYARWCMSENIPGACDGILNASVDNLKRLKEQMVSSPLHLQRWLDAVFEPESAETTDNVYRCFLWMAFAGIEAQDDILRLTARDVNLENMTVHLDGKEYPIYREALPSVRNCTKLTEFFYKKQSYQMRIYSNQLLRGIRSDQTVVDIRNILTRKITAAIKDGRTNMRLTTYRIWLSGTFYRMYERELAGFPVDFSSVAANHIRVEYRGKDLPVDGKLRKNILRVSREYTIDYERWKSAMISR